MLKYFAILLLVLTILSAASLRFACALTQYLAAEQGTLPTLLGRQYVIEDCDNLTWLYKPNTLVVAAPMEGSSAGLGQGSVVLYAAWMTIRCLKATAFLLSPALPLWMIRCIGLSATAATSRIWRFCPKTW